MIDTEERIVEVWDGKIRVRVQVGGMGPPLVYLHAVFGLTWDPFLDALAAEHTVYAVELPGTTPGDPDAIKHLDDVWDLVLCYYEVFDALGLESPVVVGHSFGGMMAAELAATNPDRVSKLVMLCPIGLWRDDLPFNNPLVMTLPELGQVAFHDPEGPVAQLMLTMPEDPAMQAEVIIAITWSMACAAKFFWPIPDRGLRKRLHRVTAPTLVVWGESDKILSPAYAEEFVAEIADARAEMVDSAAHVPQLERLDIVPKIVNGFLAG